MNQIGGYHSISPLPSPQLYLDNIPSFLSIHPPTNPRPPNNPHHETPLPPFLLALPLLTAASPPPTNNNTPGLPFILTTWSGPFLAATDAAFLLLHPPNTTATPIDAVELGCSTCELAQCDSTVGPFGSADEACETTLDALLMDGTTLNTGAVAGLRRIRHAVAVARRVLEHTRHSLLVGDQATAFAVENGFLEEDISDDGRVGGSRERCEAWRRGGEGGRERGEGHDTISMVAISRDGKMAAGTSTNGAAHKVPGRVGDGPIVGSGSYVDGEVGGCGATGDGDVMMRFLPCYQAVENLRRGMKPREAAEDAVRRMLRRYPDVASGVVVTDTKGNHAGAGSGWTFTYSTRGGDMAASEVFTIPPLKAEVGEGLGIDALPEWLQDL
ncbi:nucleophile aminohydrolase [Schizothecium vesticola]|uniref:Nucleophile aminohydrolase n=1 Tax=Schizothecium vesticola TaxID=314040 RepID=A0AA40F2Y4_9PEZI|nr:nucleophile aminohydrolase [Schizothecium vesticola]